MNQKSLPNLITRKQQDLLDPQEDLGLSPDWGIKVSVPDHQVAGVFSSAQLPVFGDRVSIRVWQRAPKQHLK